MQGLQVHSDLSSFIYRRELDETQNFSRIYQDLRTTGHYATVEGRSVL